jgi:hypothetical protein
MADRKVVWNYSNNVYGGYFRSLDLSGFAGDPEGKRECVIENGVMEDRITPERLLANEGLVHVGEFEVEGSIAFPGGQFASTNECMFHLRDFPEPGSNLIALINKQSFEKFMEGLSPEVDPNDHVSLFAEDWMKVRPKDKKYKVVGYQNPTNGEELVGFTFALAKQKIALFRDNDEWKTLVVADSHQTPISTVIL